MLDSGTLLAAGPRALADWETPRLARFGALAPLPSGLFFGLYHSWQPYSFATVFLLGSGLSYVVWWKRDIRLGIGLHVLANSIARLAYLAAVLAR